MDRKINDEPIPKRQRWLYQLSDMGLVRAILFIWGICCVTMIIVLGALKWYLSHHK